MQKPQNIYNIYFPCSFSQEVTKECATPTKNQIKGEKFDKKAHDLTQEQSPFAPTLNRDAPNNMTNCTGKTKWGMGKSNSLIYHKSK